MATMANEVKIVLTAVDKASSTLNKTSVGIKDAVKAIGAFSGAAIAAGAAIKKIADDTAAYNKQIRELTQVTGGSAEEISRIVQVSDDWGISVDQVRTALAMMNKNGLSPTIDNLAKLADEYVNTSDKTVFAEKASKLLGRQYTTLIPLFAKGGAALRDQAAAVDKSLIATDKSIAAAREYEVALDNWNDRVLALKYSIGNELLPELSRLIDDMNALGTETQRNAVGAHAEFAKRVRDSAGASRALADGIRDAYAATKDADMTGLTRNIDGVAEAAGTAAEKLDLIPVALDKITKAEFASQAVDAVTKAFKDGLIPQSQYDELMRKIGDKFTDLTDDEINQQILIANLTRSYQDGKIPLDNYIGTLEELAIAWGKIPRDVSTTYHIRYDKAPYGAEPGPGVPTPSIPGNPDYGGKKAGGGPVMAGQSYLVGERGPEILTMGGTGGMITPNDKIGGDTYYITINAAPGTDVNAVANAVIAKLQMASRNYGAGGYARGA